MVYCNAEQKQEREDMQINFSKDAWSMEGLVPAYTYRFEETPVFVQEEDCIRNSQNKEFSQGYDNVTLMSDRDWGPGTRITTRCAFEHFGAPLFVIAEKLHTDSRGVLRYGDYLEVVLYENGINVWRMWRRDGKVTWKKLMNVDFPVSAGEIHTLSAKIDADRVHVEADGHKMSVYIPDLYPSCYLGINACEGINRFYSLEIEENA